MQTKYMRGTLRSWSSSTVESHHLMQSKLLLKVCRATLVEELYVEIAKDLKKSGDLM